MKTIHSDVLNRTVSIDTTMSTEDLELMLCSRQHVVIKNSMNIETLVKSFQERHGATPGAILTGINPDLAKEVANARRTRRYSEDEIREIAKLLEPITQLELVKIKSSTNVTVRCIKCGKDSTKGRQGLFGGLACVHCLACRQEGFKGVNYIPSYSDFLDTLSEQELEYMKKWEFIGEWRGSSKICQMKCRDCGHIAKSPLRLFAESMSPCSSCSRTGARSLGEIYIEAILMASNIKFRREVKLIPDSLMRYDFELLESKILIEFDGEQHRSPIFGQERFEATLRNDQIKNQWAKDNGYRLIRLSCPAKPKNIYDVLSSELYVTAGIEEVQFSAGVRAERIVEYHKTHSEEETRIKFGISQSALLGYFEDLTGETKAKYSKRIFDNLVADKSLTELEIIITYMKLTGEYLSQNKIQEFDRANGERRAAGHMQLTPEIKSYILDLHDQGLDMRGIKVSCYNRHWFVADAAITRTITKAGRKPHSFNHKRVPLEKLEDLMANTPTLNRDIVYTRPD